MNESQFDSCDAVEVTVGSAQASGLVMGSVAADGETELRQSVALIVPLPFPGGARICFMKTEVSERQMALLDRHLVIGSTVRRVSQGINVGRVLSVRQDVQLVLAADCNVIGPIPASSIRPVIDVQFADFLMYEDANGNTTVAKCHSVSYEYSVRMHNGEVWTFSDAALDECFDVHPESAPAYKETSTAVYVGEHLMANGHLKHFARNRGLRCPSSLLTNRATVVRISPLTVETVSMDKHSEDVFHESFAYIAFTCLLPPVLNYCTGDHVIYDDGSPDGASAIVLRTFSTCHVQWMDGSMEEIPSTELIEDDGMDASAFTIGDPVVVNGTGRAGFVQRADPDARVASVCWLGSTETEDNIPDFDLEFDAGQRLELHCIVKKISSNEDLMRSENYGVVVGYSTGRFQVYWYRTKETTEEAPADLFVVLSIPEIQSLESHIDETEEDSELDMQASDRESSDGGWETDEDGWQTDDSVENGEGMFVPSVVGNESAQQDRAASMRMENADIVNMSVPADGDLGRSVVPAHEPDADRARPAAATDAAAEAAIAHTSSPVTRASLPSGENAPSTAGTSTPPETAAALSASASRSDADHERRECALSTAFAMVDGIHTDLELELERNTPPTLARAVRREWKALSSGLPPGIWVRWNSSPFTAARAAVVGTSGTPYEDAVVFFDIALSAQYPEKPPSVFFRSRTRRLHPNLYEDGTVCLSLLGTWSGENSCESWIPGQSTILQLLVSIQGLLLVEQPYFSEPGFESQKNTPAGERLSDRYNEGVRIRVVEMMLASIEHPPAGFQEIVAEHFRSRRDAILSRLQSAIDDERSSRGYRECLQRLQPRVRHALERL